MIPADLVDDDPPRLEWRIFYADGSTLDNRACELCAIPPEKRVGVVGVVQRSERRNGEVLTGPWLYHFRGKWWATDGNDNGAGMVMRWTFNAHEIDCCLPGTWIDDHAWNAIKIAMDNDPDFLPPGVEILQAR